MEIIQQWFYEWLFNYILTFVSTVTLYLAYKKLRWGGWKIKLYDSQNNLLIERNISTKKAEDIISDESDLSDYLKGVCSPYQYLKVDIVVRGKELGLLDVNKKERIITINLAKYRENFSNDDNDVSSAT
ncbi:MAG: hypothetical protein GC154_16930 [bacterium]|nr:hypothetical protein [bacterium]